MDFENGCNAKLLFTVDKTIVRSFKIPPTIIIFGDAGVVEKENEMVEVALIDIWEFD